MDVGKDCTTVVVMSSVVVTLTLTAGAIAYRTLSMPNPSEPVTNKENETETNGSVSTQPTKRMPALATGSVTVPDELPTASSKARKTGSPSAKSANVAPKPNTGALKKTVKEDPSRSRLR